jgi:sigma-B regulation protein RsbU (phosphoserine phosphatase)
MSSTPPKSFAALSPRIGLLIESLSDRFWHELVMAVDAAARRRGVQLYVFIGGTLDAPEIAARQANRCYQLASPDVIDGLIVAPLGSAAGPERLAQYFERYRPLPMAALTAVFDNIPSVCTDNVQSMQQAVSHLIVVHGVRRIAFIRGPRLNPEAELRYEGYRKALLAHGLPEEPDLVLQGDFSEQSGMRVVRELALDRSAPFEALVAANDSMALGALAELSSRGVRVPEQLLLVGFDDVPEGRWGKPSLSTVRQSLHNMADEALLQVTGALARGAARPLTLVPGDFVCRESCGCRSAFDSVTEAARPSALGGHALGAPFLADIAPAGSDSLSPDWRRELGEAFGRSRDGTAPDQLRVTIARLLEQAAASGRELGDWQRLISRLRIVLGPEERHLLESELYRCRVLVANRAERQQASLRIRSEALLHETIAAGSDVLGSFSEAGMFSALCRHFPALFLRRCLISVYEPSPHYPPDQSRLIFNYRDGRRVALPSEGQPFATPRLAPDDDLPDRPLTLTVAPLFFADSPIGILLFELGPPQGQIYDWLREQISVALEGARLLRRIDEEVAERELAERQRLAHELRLAARIQASVLPQRLAVTGLDIAASMVPATEVGGDCYDVLPFDGGAWLSIGDVAGHGLGPGVVMMMLQASVAAVLCNNPRIQPARALEIINAVLFDNVKQRLQQDEHATIMLLCYESSGRVLFAGAHEEPLIYRARTGRCEALPAPGLWIGIKPDVSNQMPESEFVLEPEDVLLLYTDGAVEAMNGRREQYGVDRLANALASVHAEPVDRIRDHLLRSVQDWMDKQRDDITLLVVRRKPQGERGE